METMQKKMMKNDENGKLSCGIYSSPAAARSPLQGWVGDRSITVDRYLFLNYRFIYLISPREEHRRYLMINDCSRITNMTKLRFNKLRQL